MPETKTKTLCSPSNGLERADEADVIAAANRLVTRTPRQPHPHPQPHPRPRTHRQGRRDAAGFTANQEVRLKAGDMRMARMQISLSQLRTQMEESSKQLRDLCTAMRLDVNAD
ncbi:uncharacterized protein LOC128263275 [Drosophila gunungcola]|uniref:uncharacterized protein LOC128263275 n=1 Tax=Drosophila gunungcola TaxID=103775 RepID=UPI0022DF666B|nr:uncharacterized protein LOC128263275 [Drosophila gunungcola]